MQPMRTCVVVLGDFGRSPRMQYHATSLATQMKTEVDVVAYPGSAPLSSIMENPRIHLHLISPPPALVQRAPRIVHLLLKMIHQMFLLTYVLLFKVPRSDYILLQNPPCLPTFTACQLTCLIRGSRLVIDWHNFGFTLLALSLSRAARPLLTLATWYEKFFGRWAHAHMCVSDAMKEELVSWGLTRSRIHVLHDCPAPFFRRAPARETCALFSRLRDSLLGEVPAAGGQGGLSCGHGDEDTPAATTLTGQTSDDHLSKWIDLLAGCGGGARVRTRQQTERQDNGAEYTRPAVLVSSTSWTADEDFSLLLEAAVQYDQRVQQDAHRKYANLLIIITGKGPERARYESLMRSLRLRHVALRTAWLSFQDYATLLGSADLGVCLHTSSSLLDLPMKVVDMFGCELPVCAVNYPTIHELVTEGESGLLFQTSEELRDCFLEVFRDFPGENKSLERLRSGAKQASIRRWDPTWEAVAKPLFQPKDKQT